MGSVYRRWAIKKPENEKVCPNALSGRPSNPQTPMWSWSHGWQRSAKTPNSKLGYLVSRREIDRQSRATDLPDTICLSSGGVRLSAEAILWFCRRIFICTSVPRTHHHTAAMSANPNQLTYSIFIANLHCGRCVPSTRLEGSRQLTLLAAASVLFRTLFRLSSPHPIPPMYPFSPNV